jgi:hypothetical protein
MEELYISATPSYPDAGATGFVEWSIYGLEAQGQGSFYLDYLEINTTPLTLQEALEDATGVWTTSDTGVAALASSVVALDHQDAVFISAGASHSWIQRAVTGPMLLTWRGGGFVTLNGGPFQGGYIDGGMYSMRVPAGEHLVRWFPWSTTDVIDTVCAVPPASLGAALDDAVAGAAGWSSSSVVVLATLPQDIGLAGNNAVLLGDYANNISPTSTGDWVQREVDGPATLSWREPGLSYAFTRENKAPLVLTVDGNEVAVVVRESLASFWLAATVPPATERLVVAQIPPGHHTLRWTVPPGKIAWMDDVTFAAPNTYRAWCQLHGLPLVGWKATADTDGDGIPQALEYAMGLDPSSANAPIGHAEIVALDTVQVSFPHPVMPPPDVTFSIELSPDLQHWTDRATAGLAIISTGNNDIITLSGQWKYARMRVVVAQ